jgi:hypothetical protein
MREYAATAPPICADSEKEIPNKSKTRIEVQRIDVIIVIQKSVKVDNFSPCAKGKPPAIDTQGNKLRES